MALEIEYNFMCEEYLPEFCSSKLTQACWFQCLLYLAIHCLLGEYAPNDETHSLILPILIAQLRGTCFH